MAFTAFASYLVLKNEGLEARLVRHLLDIYLLSCSGFSKYDIPDITIGQMKEILKDLINLNYKRMSSSLTKYLIKNVSNYQR